jgi:metal-responsive CopG/Arc/MetJ family transcriptional regulator
MDRSQLNIRVSDQLGQLIDAKRIELSKTMRSIPSRSEVIRLALEQYLNADLSDTDADRRKSKTDNAALNTITRARNRE